LEKHLLNPGIYLYSIHSGDQVLNGKLLVQ